MKRKYSCLYAVSKYHIIKAYNTSDVTIRLRPWHYREISGHLHAPAVWSMAERTLRTNWIKIGWAWTAAVIVKTRFHFAYCYNRLTGGAIAAQFFNETRLESKVLGLMCIRTQERAVQSSWVLIPCPVSTEHTRIRRGGKTGFCTWRRRGTPEAQHNVATAPHTDQVPTLFLCPP
jgi:hypothetical protein